MPNFPLSFEITFFCGMHPTILGSNVYVWQISFDVPLQIQSVMQRFQKQKMYVNWHLHFLLKCHLNVTCLIVWAISIFKVSIDVWFFFLTSHTTCQNLNCACRLMCILFLCKFLLSNVKNLQKLCQKYTLLECNVSVM